MWYYEGKKVKSLNDVPYGAVGFIYSILDENGRIYIGKKQLMSKRNKQISKKKYDELKAKGEPVLKTKDKKKSKKGKIIWKWKVLTITETDWKTYNSSSVPLKKEIKNGLKVEKQILQWCYNKKQMAYYETKWQMCSNLLENPESTWNGCVAGKYYPKDLKNE